MGIECITVVACASKIADIDEQVWNRADCCSSRLNGVEVKVGDSVCGKLTGKTTMQVVTCNKEGSSVTLLMPRRDFLSRPGGEGRRGFVGRGLLQLLRMASHLAQHLHRPLGRRATSRR